MKDCKLIIMSYVPPVGEEDWRKKINAVHAAMILSKNNRGYQYKVPNIPKYPVYDNTTSVNLHGCERVETYRLCLTENDIYNYIQDKDEYFWNEDIFNLICLDREFLGGYTTNRGYEIIPRLTNIYNNTSLSKYHVVWQKHRLLYLGLPSHTPWDSKYL